MVPDEPAAVGDADAVPAAAGNQVSDAVKLEGQAAAASAAPTATPAALTADLLTVSDKPRRQSQLMRSVSLPSDLSKLAQTAFIPVVNQNFDINSSRQEVAVPDAANQSGVRLPAKAVVRQRSVSGAAQMQSHGLRAQPAYAWPNMPAGFITTFFPAAQMSSGFQLPGLPAASIATQSGPVTVPLSSAAANLGPASATFALGSTNMAPFAPGNTNMASFAPGSTDMASFAVPFGKHNADSSLYYPPQRTSGYSAKPGMYAWAGFPPTGLAAYDQVSVPGTGGGENKPAGVVRRPSAVGRPVEGKANCTPHNAITNA